MKAIGIDLSWKYKDGRTCLAVYSPGRFEHFYLSSDDKIVEMVLSFGNPVGIDAPLIVKNTRGRRLVEKLLHEIGMIAYPANRTLFLEKYGCIRGEILVKKLECEGYELSTKPKNNGIYEVYPCASIKSLLGLNRLPRYKLGAVSSRREEVRKLARSLEDIAGVGLEDHLPPEIDRACDFVDACFASYTVWLHMNGMCNVLGNLEEGYVLVPQKGTVNYKREKSYSAGW